MKAFGVAEIRRWVLASDAPDENMVIGWDESDGEAPIEDCGRTGLGGSGAGSRGGGEMTSLLGGML